MSGSFGTDDGVELAYLLVARVAREHGIRVLAVKGPMAAEYGLRPSRSVADADILVEPNGFDRLHALMLERGWHPRSGREAPRFLAWHSRTLIHDSWPCDIDMHRYFPGFLAEAGEVFDALWADRRVRGGNYGTVLVPSRAGMAAIVALHAARSPSEARSRVESQTVADAIREGFSDDEREEFGAIVRAGRAQWVLRSIITDAGLGTPEDDALAHEKTLWRRNQLGSNEKSAALWLEQLRSAPPSKVVRVLLEAIWVPRKDIPRNDESQIPSMAESLTFQKARWRRGAEALRARAKRSEKLEP
ncbi:hypothetical protein SRABI76_02335 [Microbacterium oxydans]|uniref:nucleotidyltransferase family protein n=1 Tax=Microbacterium oxydans TaxID=82380 RepID=UPI001DEF47CE|nr:nucleotidyltransferase family protein [Microbacterium oxydans]CAH0213873.1 hypothetical protein SRABI76_02335 [Microbacterium oxydans]